MLMYIYVIAFTDETGTVGFADTTVLVPPTPDEEIAEQKAYVQGSRSGLFDRTQVRYAERGRVIELLNDYVIPLTLGRQE